MEKKSKADAKEKPALRLRRRSLADLSEKTLGDVVGGHHCNHTREGYPSCAPTCAFTCPPGHTCDEESCMASECGVCQTDECQTLPHHGGCA